MKVGQKIICIDDSPGYADGRVFLKKNMIYTIKEIHAFAGFRLLEDSFYDNPIRINGALKEMYWDDKRFKPLKYENISAELIGKITEEKIDLEIQISK